MIHLIEQSGFTIFYRFDSNYFKLMGFAVCVACHCDKILRMELTFSHTYDNYFEYEQQQKKSTENDCQK